MKILPIFIANAGCPGGCVFCDQSLQSGVVQPPTPEDVTRILAGSVPGANFDQVAFYGGSFTALPEALQRRYLEAVHPYVVSGQIKGVRLSTRPDRLTRAGVEQLCHFGVVCVELGCQSFADDVLSASGRGCKAEGHGRAVQLLRDAGLTVGIQLMPGLPGATDTEAYESLQQALSLKPDGIRIYPTVVVAGTRLAADWKAGRYRPMRLDDAVELCADLSLQCHAAGVPIMRLGLQAAAALDSGGVLAGPYHPAFGQLVQSRLWLRVMTRLTENVATPLIQVHPHDLSVALGQQRNNFDRLRRQRSGLVLEAAASVPRGAIRVADRSVDMMAYAAGNR